MCSYPVLIPKPLVKPRGEVERSIELDVSFLTYYGLDFFKVPSRGYSYNHKSLKIVKMFLRFCPGAKKRDPVRHVKGQC